MGDRERKEPQAPDPKAAAARRARAEAAAATAILLDRDAWPASAAVHLRAGWRAVVDGLDPDGDRDLPLADRLRAVRMDGLAGAERDRLAEVLDRLDRLDRGDAPEGELPEGVSRAVLRRQARLLTAESHRLLRASGVRRPPWKWVAAGAAVAAGVLLVVWAAGGPDTAGAARGEGWLGRYYPEPDFGGDPVVRYDEAIDFEWLDQPPLDGVPKDHYTVRWDTCLHLPANDTLELRLGSDDGSRLFLDGERVIDNWRDQAGNWMDYSAALDAGVHHLRVEYYENGGDALAILHVTGPGGPLPASSFRPPRLRGEDVVCAE